MTALGHHLLIDFHGCENSRLDDVEFVEEAMVAAANAMKANVVTVEFHEFNPIGISGTVVISQSHLTIHTWPEYGYAAVDIFTCGERMQVERALELLQEQFGAEDFERHEFDRGHVTRERPRRLAAPISSKRQASILD